MQLLGTPSENIWPVSARPLPSPALLPRAGPCAHLLLPAGFLQAPTGGSVQPQEAALQQPQTQVPVALRGWPAPAELPLHVRPQEKVLTWSAGRGGDPSNPSPPKGDFQNSGHAATEMPPPQTRTCPPPVWVLPAHPGHGTHSEFPVCFWAPDCCWPLTFCCLET